MPATTLPSQAEAFASRYFLTTHARERMSQRRISEAAIRTTLQCGRVLHRPGALLYVVGRQEIEEHRHLGLDLSKCDGVHVVCDTAGRVITTYRNRDLRGLRPRRRTGRPQSRTH